MKSLLHWDQTVESFWADILAIEKIDLLDSLAIESDDLSETWSAFTDQEKLDLYNMYHLSQYSLRDFAETRED